MTVFAEVMRKAGIAVDVHKKHLSFPCWYQSVEKGCYWKMCLFSHKHAVVSTLDELLKSSYIYIIVFLYCWCLLIMLNVFYKMKIIQKKFLELLSNVSIYICSNDK